MKPPQYNIDPKAFWSDPYPDLKVLRNDLPVAFVPQLGATLITRRDDIFEVEKKIDYFSSDQPDGLMTKLMGQNMMRKDGPPHMEERRAIFPSVSPKTVRDVWKSEFEAFTDDLLARIRPDGGADMCDVAKQLSGKALCAITGLRNMSWQEMDRTSQGMIDGCANYTGDPDIEANCHDCTASIDRHISDAINADNPLSAHALLDVQIKAGMPMDQVRANIKLAISGGQNEPRDVIAGMVWALLAHPDQCDLVMRGQASWMQVFDEFTRWQSPIGMSPRRMAQRFTLHDIDLDPGDRVFLMFGSANRDERCFTHPDQFDISQDAAKSIAFGAGPHFCAGAWASRCLIAEVILPRLFQHLPNLRLSGPTEFGGWAFRGPLSVPVSWVT